MKNWNQFLNEKQYLPERQNNIRTLIIGGNKKVEKILDHIYYDSTIFLKRKYDKYIELKCFNIKK